MNKPHPTSLAMLSPASLADNAFGLAENVHQSQQGMHTPSLFDSIRLSLSSDEELARNLQQGNPDALTVLFKRHSNAVFGIARRILRNDSEAEDAVQKVFFDVFRAIRQFDAERGSFRTWLLIFAYHRTYNHRRALLSERYFEADGFDDLNAEQWSHARLHSRHSVSEAKLVLDEALSKIQPRQRRTIELIHFEGLTAEETAARTGETVSVVRHNLYRGMKALRKLMSESSGAGTNIDPRSVR